MIRSQPGPTRRPHRAQAGAACVLLAILLAGCTGPSPDPAAAARALEAGRRERAVELVQGWQPTDPNGWNLLAAVYQGLSEHRDEAFRAFAPAGRSDDPGLVLLAARVAADADRPGEGAEWLREALDAHPQVDELAIEYAKLLGRLGRHRESVAVLAPRAGSDPRLLNLAGYAWMLAGEPGRAEAFLERSVAEARRHGRDYAPPHYHLGLLHLDAGRLEEALAEFSLAIAANPDHLEAHYQRMGVAERLALAEVEAEARAAFGQLYSARLADAGALDATAARIPEAVYRGESFEWRPAVEASEFTRSVRAGSTLELACRAPAGAAALFEVHGPEGPLLSVVHEGTPDEARWIPHQIDVPAGEGSVALDFRVQPASRLARWFGGGLDGKAAFSEPFVLPALESRSGDGRPNILLVSLDTLRADRVGAYGHPRATTPRLDALAARGVLFERAEAPSNWTLPSHYSLFSGLTPAAHGVMPDLKDVRGYIHPDRQLAVRGSGRERMLAEALAEEGYRTAAVTENGWVSGRFGFDQGFQLYRSAEAGSLPATAAASLAELEAAGERGPWFLFVHTYAPHQPYHAPRELRTRWASPAHEGIAWPEAMVPISEYNRFHLRTLFPPAPSDVRAFSDLYDGQVAWSDGLVGQLVDWLEGRGLLEQTVVVVTSDHGEEIFERGQFDHGDTLYEEVTRVPLVLHAPGRLPAGVRVRGPVSLIDLPATLLDLVGTETELGQGRSLRSLWEGPLRSDRTVHAQAIGHGSEPLAAVWQGPLKYLRRDTAAGVDERLFDLEQDPGERRNLAAQRPDELARLREEWREHIAQSETIRATLGADGEELDPETLERLRSLGYAH
jgi:arylsulfatase A-like enzyme/tetratricopeptide (TPR) repeat protein